MELVRFPSRGGFSVRSIFTFVFAVIVTALLWATFTSAPTHAADGANWKGETIIYNGRQFYPGGIAKKGQSHGLAEGTTYYLAVEEVESPAAAPSKTAERKAFILYFAPGVDPPTATSATFVTYQYSEANEFSHPSGRTTIDITPPSESGTYGSSCDVKGIGWIVCPVSTFLAQAMDWVFDQVAQFVAVRPLSVNDAGSPLYTAWNTVRSIANIAFIIAFLIIIYSQLTSTGISNYGLKKLIPRLVVAAVLVNVSFYLSAIAVDISNIAGYSLQQILMQIHDNTFAITGDTWQPSATNAWSTITGIALSGGAATYGVIGLSVATAGSPVSLIYVIIPLLLGLLVTLLFVLLILAARQAIIIILIVIAPLAFVANLLPNTEKWFDKWKDLFMTMLVFFPAFSLVFGGAQLAGGIIIQNATSFIMMIFGLAVQVAPLVITPLLLKLSGGLLGRVAGIVNNPRKGLVDRTKNWSNEKRDMHRANSIANGRGGNPFRTVARRLDAGKRNTKKATDLYNQQVETNYMDGNARFARLNDAEHETHMNREIVDNRHKLRAQEHINHEGSSLHIKNVQVELSKRALEVAMQSTAADISEYAANHRPENAAPEFVSTIARLNTARQTLSIEKSRAANAESVQQTRLADALINDATLRARAGGIDAQGADASLAGAIETVRSSYAKSVSAADQIIKHFNLSSDDRQKLALGETVTAVRDDGTTHTFTASDTYAREAAIEKQIAVGTIDQVEQLVMLSGKGAALAEFRTTISEALAKNALGGKSIYLGGKTIDDVAKGTVAGPEGIARVAAEAILKGKFSQRDLASIDPIAAGRMFEVALRVKNGDMPEGIDQKDYQELVQKMGAFSKLARDTLRGEEKRNVKDKAQGFIVQIAQLTDPNFTLPTDDEPTTTA